MQKRHLEKKIKISAQFEGEKTQVVFDEAIYVNTHAKNWKINPIRCNLSNVACKIKYETLSSRRKTHVFEIIPIII